MSLAFALAGCTPGQLSAVQTRVGQAFSPPAVDASAIVPAATVGAATVPAIPGALPDFTSAAGVTAPPADARPRLQGVVLHNNQPVQGAFLAVVDLITGKPVAFRPWEQETAGDVYTDAKGRFDLELGGNLTPTQMLLVKANTDRATYLAVLHGGGLSIGGAPQGAYRLAQDRVPSVMYRLRLTPGTTASVKGFQGLLKVTRQRENGEENYLKHHETHIDGVGRTPDSLTEADRRRNRENRAEQEAASLGRRSRIFAWATGFARDFDAHFSKRPDLSATLVGSLYQDGTIRDRAALKDVLYQIPDFEAKIRLELEAGAGNRFTVTEEGMLSTGADTEISPVSAGDFPTIPVKISPQGSLAWPTMGELVQALSPVELRKDPIKLAGTAQTHYIPTDGEAAEDLPTRRRRRGALAPGGGAGPTPPSGPSVDPLDAPFTGSLYDAYSAAVVDAGAGTLAGHVLGVKSFTAPFSGDANLFVYDPSGAEIASRPALNDLGEALFNGLAAYPGSTTVLVANGVLAGGGVGRYTRNADWSYAMAEVGYYGADTSKYLFGGAVAGQRYWAFTAASVDIGNGGGKDRIVSFAIDNLLAGALTIQSGGGDLDLSTIPDAGFARDLAVSADGTATHVYWVDNDGDLFRCSQGAPTTVTKLYDFGGTTYGAVAMKNANQLYVVSNGSLWSLSNPAAATFPAAPTAVASAPGNVSSGDQGRDGSVVFSSDASGVIRIPVP